jgi:hypothetical protein
MKRIAATLTLAMLLVAGANANFIEFDQTSYSGAAGDRITVTINYDFTSFAMFGGGLDLLFDPTVVDFVSFTQNLAPDAQATASPVGAEGAAGEYLGFGIGTFDFFSGMTSAGTVGIFEFDLLAPPGLVLATSCGQVLCLTPKPFLNPFVSLIGDFVTADLFPAGFLGAAVEFQVDPVVPVPAPFTLSLFGIGLVGLGWSRRKKV